MILPSSKPKLTKAEAELIVKHYLGANVPPLVIIGVRGYYSKMGKVDVNDINIYDDAVILWGLGTYETYNGNTDPSFVKKGGRSLAKLNPGVYKFAKGKHKGKYDALRAYPEGVVLPCTRDGKPAECSFINIHKGGLTQSSAGVTWSEGCTTIPSSQYLTFIKSVYKQMSKANIRTVHYILLENEQMKEILKGI